MNIVTRIPVQSARASVVIPASNLSALLKYDPSAFGFWSLYDASLASKAGSLILAAQDEVNKPPVFNAQGLLVDSVYQDAYLPTKSNGGRVFDADMPAGVTLITAFKYAPIDFSADPNVILAGNMSGSTAGMGLVTYQNRPGFTIAAEAAQFAMTTSTLTADWCFAALSYDKAARKVAVYWKQAATGIERSYTFTGTDATPYVPSTTLAYGLGNASFGSGSHPEKSTVAEFAMYDRSMTLAELVAKYSESQVRLLAQGIVI